MVSSGCVPLYFAPATRADSVARLAVRAASGSAASDGGAPRHGAAGSASMTSPVSGSVTIGAGDKFLSTATSIRTCSRLTPTIGAMARVLSPSPVRLRRRCPRQRSTAAGGCRAHAPTASVAVSARCALWSRGAGSLGAPWRGRLGQGIRILRPRRGVQHGRACKSQAALTLGQWSRGDSVNVVTLLSGAFALPVPAPAWNRRGESVGREGRPASGAPLSLPPAPVQSLGK